MLLVVPPSNLAAAEQERDAVREVVEGKTNLVLLEGPRASASAVRRLLAEVAVVHFVGHASSMQDGWGGGFCLAYGDALEVRDVLALPRVPRVVVLAGCETGRIDGRTLAGGMSLAHAFLVAGAEAVVAADERIDDRASAALAGPFHSARQDGEPPARALARARAAAIREGASPPPLRVWVH